MFIRRNGEISRNKHFTSERTDVIFHIIDQIKVSRIKVSRIKVSRIKVSRIKVSRIPL